MEAKSFISNKHAAAVENLRAIEAEYLSRMSAARAEIALTQKWLDELGGEAVVEKPITLETEIVEPIAEKIPFDAPTHESNIVELIAERPAPAVARTSYAETVLDRNGTELRSNMQAAQRRPSESWVSARDLLPKVR